MGDIEDRPPFISVSKPYDSYCVSKHEWSSRQDSYQIVHTEIKHSKGEAWVFAREWAKKEGIEVR